MKLCRDCKFRGHDIFGNDKCDRLAHDSKPDPVDGSTYKTGREFCSIERGEPTFLFTFRCGPKGRYFQPKGTA